MSTPDTESSKDLTTAEQSHIPVKQNLDTTPDTEGMTEVQKRVDDIKEQIDENLRLTSRIPYNTTPDTKWSVEELMCDLRYLASPYAETLSDMQRTSLFILLVNRLDKVLSSRDTTPDTEMEELVKLNRTCGCTHGWCAECLKWKSVVELATSSRDTYWKERVQSKRETLAELEHDQWIAWSKNIAETEQITPARLERWKKLWRPYAELTETEKDQDREWADKVLDTVLNNLK